MDPIYILIVEDDLVIASKLRCRLEQIGCIVTAIVSSGNEAIEKTREVLPHFIFMNIKYRERRDDIKAYDIIKQQFNIPIVYFDGYSDKKEVNQWGITEADECILKLVEDGSHRFNNGDISNNMAINEWYQEYNRLLMLFDDFEGPVFSVDSNNRFLLWNTSIASISGYTSGEILNKSIDDIGIFLNGDEVLHAIEQARDSGVVASQSIVLKSKSNDRLMFNGSMYPDVFEKNSQKLAIVYIGKGSAHDYNELLPYSLYGY